jgi:excisionase family DNA binding protein
MTEKISYTLKEAAAASGLGRTTLYELINRGELRLVKIGTRTLIRRLDLVAMLDRNLVQAAA